MPPYPSDNLYSADDDTLSDTESFSEELSPTDGYFQRPEMSSHSQLVPDPTIDYGPAEAKTLIDPPSSQGTGSRIHPSLPSRSMPSSLSDVPSSPSPRHIEEYAPVSPTSHRLSRGRGASIVEQEPLLYQPPPAYSESPPSSFRSLPNGESYDTFSRQLALPLQRREPESMGGPLEEPPSEDTPLIALKKKFTPRRRRIQALLFAGLILTVIGTTLAILIGCPDEKSGEPREPESQYCPQASFRRNEAVYEFSSHRELSLIHKIKDESNPAGYASVSSQGEIRLRQAPTDSKHGSKPYVTVNIGSSWDVKPVLSWSEDLQILEVSTPSRTDSSTSKPQCLYIIITAFFPEDAEMTTLLFDSPTLNMALSDIKMNVTGRSQFSTRSGHAWFTAGVQEDTDSSIEARHPSMSSKPKWIANTTETVVNFSSRRTIVESHSGHISGSYPLFDDLLLSSESGSITVGITPKAASDSHSTPADLEVQTASGAINVHLPQYSTNDTVPLRDYITRVHTTSGNIYGNYFLGSESSFKTTSGSIDIVTLPILAAEANGSKRPPNAFETHTLTGSTKVSVLPPIIFLPIKELQNPFLTTLRSLRSSHSSNSGRVHTVYPDLWQGTVHAKTVSGGLEVTGEGFRTIKERAGWAFKEVLKRRAVQDQENGSVLEASTISGSVNFEIS